MRIRAGVLAAFLLLAAGCSTSTPPQENLTPQQADYVAKSAGIDSRLSADHKAALDLGTSICRDLAAGKQPAEIAAEAQRFTHGEGTISLEQAKTLVETARRDLCH